MVNCHGYLDVPLKWNRVVSRRGVVYGGWSAVCVLKSGWRSRARWQRHALGGFGAATGLWEKRDEAQRKILDLEARQ